MPIYYNNLYTDEFCKRNLINFILNLSSIKKSDFKNYKFEECYRMYYNLAISNTKKSLNIWISSLMNEILNKNQIIKNIDLLSDILMYILNLNNKCKKEKLFYDNSPINKEKFISLCEEKNNKLISKRLIVVKYLENKICNDLTRRIVMEY